VSKKVIISSSPSLKKRGMNNEFRKGKNSEIRNLLIMGNVF